tara:strand:- start:37 stop:363 length:327 start_codon:yes stop_codon:yes gene_type:complete
MFNDIATAAMTSPELAKIRSKAEQGTENLESWETAMLDMYLGSFLDTIKVVYDQEKIGMHKQFDADVFESQVRFFTNMPSADGCWVRWREAYSGPFSRLAGENFEGDT